ncbi:MAG: KH domain-containing protein [Myxococcota bacterium]|nr:KH domain-containing protein [Myxococcota bacterium]MDW8361008.1 KH domain-containing protein [Myxococcales bacterium]
MDDERRKGWLGGPLIVEDEDEDDVGAAASRGRPGDGKAEQALEVLDAILAHMDLDAEVSIREDGPEQIVLDVRGPDAGRAIGKKGSTLEALQLLVTRIVNRAPHGRRRIVLDSGDYRARYEQSLVSLARREARRAVSQGRVVTLEPMSPRDRRVIHLSLAKFEGVTTRSDGEGVGRRIQIIPARIAREPDRGRSRPR